MNYKKIIINTISIFLISVICHFTYNIIPCFFTSIFFPVNESIMEHVKMLFTASVLFTFISYFFTKENNLFIKASIRGIILNIILLIIYLPIYYSLGEILPLTIVIEIISIAITEIIMTYIPLNKENRNLDLIGLGILIGIYIVFSIWTYFPPKLDLFFDPENEKYGIDILDNRTS